MYNNTTFLIANAGTFKIGVIYTIVTAGDTDFTLIGAANSTPGTVFTATGLGTGTGTANSGHISSDFISIEIENLAPILKITDGLYITAGDSLTITSYEGNLLYVNGEQIGFTTIDFTTNSVGGLQRGMNGTAIQSSIPTYTEVVGLLANNKLSNVYYNQTWNSNNFNSVLGDPLQISTTVPAQFLHTDVT